MVVVQLEPQVAQAVDLAGRDAVDVDAVTGGPRRPPEPCQRQPRRLVSAPAVEVDGAAVGREDADHAIGRSGSVEPGVDRVEQRRADPAPACVGPYDQRDQLVEHRRRHERRQPVRGRAADKRVAEVDAILAGDQRVSARGEDRLVHRPPHGPRRGVVDVGRQLRGDRLVVGMEQQPERLETLELRGVELVEDHRGAI